MDRLRLAVIGVGCEPGARSGGHLDTIMRLAHAYELVALCDMDATRLRAAGEHYGVKALYTDLNTMLATEALDVAYRLTPTDSATMVCLKLAEAGVHVISEIPIASTLGQADALIEACSRNGVLMEVAENVWLWPEEQLKQAISRKGLIGQPILARLKYPCGGYHGFNAIRMILGSEPRRALGYAGLVPVQPQRSYGGTPMRECFFELGIFEFANGVTLSYEMPPKGRTWRRNWDIEGTHGQLCGERLITVHAEPDADGHDIPLQETEYPIESVFDDVEGHQILREVRVNTPVPVVWTNPYRDLGISAPDDIAKAEILMSMHRAVTAGVPLRYGPDNGRRDLEMWIAVRESALRQSAWMELPLTEPTEIEHQLTTAFRNRYHADPITGVDALVHTPFNRLSVMWDVAGWL